jgi:hypothetical protein
MELTGTQSSALYFKRHKRSKRRAALFLQLRATSTDQTRDVKEKAVANAYTRQRFRSEQLSLKGFVS